MHDAYAFISEIEIKGEKMEIFLYSIIFITGCFFGSFFTLAVYRIPKKEDILIKHSYCPNCNHKLGFLDLFPIFSYIFLRGKCRYCKNKIRPRYFLLELLSGITFVLLALSYKVNIFNINIISLFFSYIYIAILFIVAGIDKENINIEKGPLIVGFAFEVLYIIYQCALNNIDVYKYVIYLVFLCIILILRIITLKRKMKEKYYIQILLLTLYIIIFSGSKIFILSAILTLLSIAFYKIGKSKNERIPIGFFLSVCNILVIIITNFICNYIM